MSIGLLLTALGLGLRHGVDWDHIAAIADLSGNAENRRRGFILSMAYAVGHGAVVFLLGTAAIAFGLAIPDGFDELMGRIVGVTLILLGLWIIAELLRKGQDFRLRSRWMLVIDGTFAGFRKVRNGIAGRKISVEHDHEHEHVDAVGAEDHGLEESNVIDLRDRFAHDHSHVREPATVPATAVGEGTESEVAGWRGLRDRIHGHSHAPSSSHSHNHSHDLALPDQAGASYGNKTATGIGMLHGVGIESPTQIAIFVASSAAAGVGFGLALLGTWVLGLIIANAVLAVAAGAGLLNAERSFPIYATIAVIVSVLSIALGLLYVVGLDILPALS